MPDVPINIVAGTIVLTPVAIPDDLHTVAVSIPAWTQVAQQVSMLFDLSFTAGVSWVSLGTMAPKPGGAVSPRSPTVGVSLSPLPLLCSICGVEYLPGDGRYARALSHSTIGLKAGRTLTAFRTRLPVADRGLNVADFKTRIATADDGRDVDDEYFDRVFHTPTPVLPASRLLRITVTCTRALNTILTVTSS